jgi:hypothetical protein
MAGRNKNSIEEYRLFATSNYGTRAVSPAWDVAGSSRVCQMSYIEQCIP